MSPAEDEPRRRLHDKLGPMDKVEIYLEFQKQEMELKKISEKMPLLDRMQLQLESIAVKLQSITPSESEQEQQKKERELLFWHEKLLKILGSICILAIPALTSFAISLQLQVSELSTSLRVAELRLEFLERTKNEKTESPNITKIPDRKAWNIWVDHDSRTGKF